ncbi:MAG: hypothetical protein JW910_19460, partial [Anaerolineae bacterium]|nr:hypothetical protein [Anaerolineae bacterium]
MPPPFTFAAYEDLCRAIVAADLTVLPVMEALASPLPARCITLRYDIDGRPEHALVMARLLARHGLRGTFYWHAAPPELFRVDLMRQVASLGHEIGYHYAALAACGGDVEAAAARFMEEAGRFHAAGFAVRTAAAHGSRGYDNKALLRARPDLLAACGLTGEAYLGVDFARVQYVSDAGWAWRRYPVRADAQEYRAEQGVRALPCLSQTDLCTLIAACPLPLYLNTHPELWFASGLAARGYRWRRRIGECLLAREAARRL